MAVYNWPKGSETTWNTDNEIMIETVGIETPNVYVFEFPTGSGMEIAACLLEDFFKARFEAKGVNPYD